MATGNREAEASRARTLDYPTWHDACKASRFEKAISKEVITIVIPRGTFKVRIVKPLSGQPYAVYHTAQGITVHDWKPTTAAVDGVQKWRPW
jgi:hypothetical protein